MGETLSQPQTLGNYPPLPILRESSLKMDVFLMTLDNSNTVVRVFEAGFFRKREKGPNEYQKNALQNIVFLFNAEY